MNIQLKIIITVIYYKNMYTLTGGVISWKMLIKLVEDIKSEVKANLELLDDVELHEN